MENSDFIEAEACFRKAVQVAPDFAEAYANLGLVLDKQGMADNAEIHYLRSIELNPSHPETHLNLGALLANNKRFIEAESFYKQAISLRPHSPIGWSNLGVLYACMKREEEAEKCYRTAIFLDASYAKAYFNFSYLLLLQGRFEEGWRCLEVSQRDGVLAAHFTCPLWRGDALFDKSLLISYEAGQGDAIQFCRYIALLKAQGAQSITLICHPALKNLFAELEGADIADADRAGPQAQRCPRTAEQGAIAPAVGGAARRSGCHGADPGKGFGGFRAAIGRAVHHPRADRFADGDRGQYRRPRRRLRSCR